MIEISNLTKTLNKKNIISDFSFNARQKECLGLFGEGPDVKTMLLNLLSGSTQPTGGHININGINMQSHPHEARQVIGYQRYKDLNHPTMSVKAFLNYIAAIHGYCGAEKRDRVEQAVTRLELYPTLNAPLDALCVYAKRKVSVAQAILHTPALLLLDEPTAGLAADQALLLKALIRSLTQETTIIIASRNSEELAEFCTRGLLIVGNRLVADTPMLDLQRNSRHFQAVTLSADTPLDLLALAVLPGVAGIEEHRHAPGTVTVLAMPGHAIYPHVHTLIANRRWKINALNLEPGRMNDVVQQLSQERPH
ncbi:ABC transporter ATP-binding protein [Pseudomonas rhodesiae]|uniref:ABC transporter ATP-binding protein n=1 Tax=Pseudomonas rhodesiae TaxID=76760 RepID=UPI0032B19599